MTENKGDLISRSEVVKILENVEIGKFNRVNVIETIKSISAVERPQGEWVIDNWGMYHCNYCMKEKQQLFNNFCSFCGADMRKPNYLKKQLFGNSDRLEKREEE